MKKSAQYQELERVSHALVSRHGALIRSLRGLLYSDADAKLSGLAAQFELLVILEVLDHRQPVAEALLALDLKAAGKDVIQAHRDAIGVARSLAVREAELGDLVEKIYKAVVSAQ